MKDNRKFDSNNPLSDLINDKIYDLLNARGLINEKSVRDHIIRKKFKIMRESKINAHEAIEALRKEYPYLQFDTIRKEYPYLQFDTIRKIVYQILK